MGGRGQQPEEDSGHGFGAGLWMGMTQEGMGTEGAEKCPAQLLHSEGLLQKLPPKQGYSVTQPPPQGLPSMAAKRVPRHLRAVPQDSALLPQHGSSLRKGCH